MATGLVESGSSRGRSAEMRSMEALLNVAVSCTDARVQLRQTYTALAAELQSLREEVKSHRREAAAAKKERAAEMKKRARERGSSENLSALAAGATDEESSGAHAVKSIKRAYNFSAGPASIPLQPLLTMQKELPDCGVGAGIIELSHRDKNGPVQTSVRRAAENIKKLLEVPDTHEVLLMHGGAHGQFAAVPLNLLGAGSMKKRGAYVDGGVWSRRAMSEGAKYCDALLAASAADSEYTAYPPVSEWNIPEDCAFVHVCSNETIEGLEFHTDPDVGPDRVLVADFTSSLLSRRVDVSKYGVLYASSGKNLGPSGVCVVIVRKSLMGTHKAETPSILTYSALAGLEVNPILGNAQSPNLYNTPNTFACRMVELITDDLIAKGGMDWAEKQVKRRSAELYSLIDSSNNFYVNTVDAAWRSRVTIIFKIRPDLDADAEEGSVGGGKALENKFVAEAHAAGFQQLFGHPISGGLRVCLYNGVSEEAFKALMRFMKLFMRRNK